MAKKEVIFVFAVILILVFAGFSSALFYDKKILDQCKKDCRYDRTVSKVECASTFKDCKLACNNSSCRKLCAKESKSCLIEINNEYKSCKNYCSNNMVDFSINEDECQTAGGLYRPLCNGPYFDLVCSQQNFCICQGDNNYSCPSNYQCTANFISPVKRDNTVYGWKTTGGMSLGNIGICAKTA